MAAQHWGTAQRLVASCLLALPIGKLRAVFCGTDLGFANSPAAICALLNQDWRGVGGQGFCIGWLDLSGAADPG